MNTFDISKFKQLQIEKENLNRLFKFSYIDQIWKNINVYFQTPINYVSQEVSQTDYEYVEIFIKNSCYLIEKGTVKSPNPRSVKAKAAFTQLCESMKTTPEKCNYETNYSIYKSEDNKRVFMMLENGKEQKSKNLTILFK